MKQTRKNKQTRRANNHSKTKLPPKSINDHIDHVLYINLDRRPDRKEQIERQLSVFDSHKITRVPGVLHKNPAIGCATSHIHALKMAKEHGWPNVLIVEDDAIWANVDKAYPVFEKLIKDPYDVIMLGGTYPSWEEKSYRVKHALSTCAYLVHHSYYDKLIHAVEEGLVTRNASGHNIAVNVSFTMLQPVDNWFLVRPAFMIQRKSHSNIVGGIVNYKKLFK